MRAPLAPLEISSSFKAVLTTPFGTRAPVQTQMHVHVRCARARTVASARKQRNSTRPARRRRPSVKLARSQHAMSI
eukprot:5790279-Lingulodinium_polyedra.AAC.1